MKVRWRDSRPCIPSLAPHLSVRAAVRDGAENVRNLQSRERLAHEPSHRRRLKAPQLEWLEHGAWGWGMGENARKEL
jgi:hypothetical protein